MIFVIIKSVLIDVFFKVVGKNFLIIFCLFFLKDKKKVGYFLIVKLIKVIWIGMNGNVMVVKV